MGAHPYWYFVEYQKNVGNALNALREREFRAGRYNPVTPFIDFPIAANSPAPGPQHSSPQGALASAEEEGTRSILDISAVSDTPDFCVASPLDAKVLKSVYGTTTPSRAQVEKDMAFMESIERGHCVYFFIYENGEPKEIFFGGFSFD